MARPTTCWATSGQSAHGICRFSLVTARAGQRVPASVDCDHARTQVAVAICSLWRSTTIDRWVTGRLSDHDTGASEKA